MGLLRMCRAFKSACVFGFSVCSAYFFRVAAFSPTNAGGVTVDFHGRLWLPFFYKNPPPGSPSWYGTWLPIDIEICTVFPVFIED